MWRALRAAWTHTPITTSTHNYDMGQFHLEDHATRWRLFAPTAPGPQRWGAGGEIALWESPGAGETWTETRRVTRDSPQNHGYVRRPLNAHPDFYAFWAGGNPRDGGGVVLPGTADVPVGLPSSWRRGEGWPPMHADKHR